MADADFEGRLRSARASLMCQRKGDEGLYGAPLKSCTQSTDGSTTGWTRSGSCNWSPDDSGYHEVCVTMSDEFLQKSAQHDANDLSSVVQAGGHWCICAWAWASAVQRDPSNYEGITLDCERTNAKLAVCPLASSGGCSTTTVVSIASGRDSDSDTAAGVLPAVLLRDGHF